MSILVNILLGLLARLFMLGDDDADIPRPQVGGSPPCFFLSLDNSVSMGNEDAPGSISRREAARNAAEGALSYIYENNPRAVVGVGAYSNYFHHVTGPRVIGDHYQTMLDDLQGLGPTGDTAIGRGLEGIQQMVEKCPPESRKVLVLLTDGRQNTGRAPIPVARELRDQGVDIHTVGIGSRDKIKEEDLREIASSPDQFTFLENWEPGGLLEEFTRIAQIIEIDDED